MSSAAKEKIILALDTPNADSAARMLDQIGDSLTWIKVGMQLFNAEGPALIEQIKARGYRLFLDLKFHDIPNTVYEAIQTVTRLGVDMTTIHLSGGAAMIAAAHKGTTEHSPLILGVTVLTSMNETELAGIGVGDPVPTQVARLVALGCENGLRGVVCSPLEIALLREAHGDAVTIVTPGVRPQGSDKGDQQRVMTPSEAIAQGADYLVIGRPITGALSPRDAAISIAEEIASLGNS